MAQEKELLDDVTSMMNEVVAVVEQARREFYAHEERKTLAQARVAIFAELVKATPPSLYREDAAELKRQREKLADEARELCERLFRPLPIPAPDAEFEGDEPSDNPFRDSPGIDT